MSRINLLARGTLRSLTTSGNHPLSKFSRNLITPDVEEFSFPGATVFWLVNLALAERGTVLEREIERERERNATRKQIFGRAREGKNTVRHSFCFYSCAVRSLPRLPTKFVSSSSSREVRGTLSLVERF